MAYQIDWSKKIKRMMKKFVNLSILIVGAVLTGCSGRPQIREGFNYPEMISPIYYLDTFQIQKPLIVYIDSEPYITSEAVFDSVADKTALRETRGVVRYLTRDLALDRAENYSFIHKEPKRKLFHKKTSYSYLCNVSFCNIEKHFQFLDSVQGVAVYRFKYKPRNFLLTLISAEEYKDSRGRFIFGEEYSNDYILAMLPLYSREILPILDSIELL